MLIACLVALGAVLLASASPGGSDAPPPRLLELRAELDRAAGAVRVSGRVGSAGSVFVGFGGNCRVVRVASHGALRHFELVVPRGGSPGRARRCRTAVARRAAPLPAAKHSAVPGPVRVIACNGRSCRIRFPTLRTVPARSPLGSAAPAGATEVPIDEETTVPVPKNTIPVPPDEPASRFVSTTGSDSGQCDDAVPCRTFNRAYEVAEPGEIVDVAGGIYPSQRIEHDSSKTSSEDVFFRPVAGEAVEVDGDIEVYGSHVTLMAMRALDTNVPYDGPVSVTDVTFWAMDGRTFTFDSATRISVIGGDYGPASSCGGPYGGGNNGIRKNSPTMPSDILIWGVDFHDIQSHDLVQCHIECLIVGAGRDIVVRGSRFWNCSIFDIFLQPFNGAVSGITLENNWFAAPTGLNGQVNSTRAVEFSGDGPWQDLLIRHNSVNTAINLTDRTPVPQYVNVSVIGNIARRAGCYSGQGVVYRANVWDQGACDASDASLGGGPFPFVQASNGQDLDYHLTGGVAVDRVPTATSGLGEDIDGEARPDGAAADAGSDER